MTGDAPLWRGCAFGLQVTSLEPLETLTACSGDARAYPVSWARTTDRAALEQDWSGIGVNRLVDSRFPDGSQMMSVDADANGAYLVESPGLGIHVVSAAGTRITSALSPDSPWNWQRLLIAQALPLAAAIQGLEPLHASAVSLDGCAVAFTAPSNTGKTSIALHLVARGAGLLTDDVLSVEMTPTTLLAHPGARLLGAARHELDAVQTGRERLGAVLSENGKVYLRPSLDYKPLPLAAIYRLARYPAGSPFRILEELPPDPRALLATTFLTYLRAPERLIRHLEFAARFAHDIRMFVVDLPADTSAHEAAEHLEQHIRAEVCFNRFSVSPTQRAS